MIIAQTERYQLDSDGCVYQKEESEDHTEWNRVGMIEEGDCFELDHVDDYAFLYSEWLDWQRQAGETARDGMFAVSSSLGASYGCYQ